MRLYPRNGFWQVEFEHDGVRKRLAVGLPATAPKGDAERAAMERMRATFATPATATTTAPDKLTSMAEALNKCYLVRWRETTSAAQMNASMRQLTAQVGHWMLRDITFNRLLDLQQKWLGDGQKPATVNRKMSMIRTTLKLASKLDSTLPMPSFPSILRENNVRDRYLSDAEDHDIAAYLDRMAQAEAILGTSADWAQVRDLYVILRDTGMRLGELLQLTQLNLHTVKGRLMVQLTGKMTKTKKARIIPLTDAAATAAQRWLTYPKRKPHWVQHRWGLVRQSCTGVDDVNVHILRHTCAVRLLKAGVGIYTVAKWLGHSSVKITERYSSVVPDMLEDALARLTAA